MLTCLVSLHNKKKERKKKKRKQKRNKTRPYWATDLLGYFSYLKYFYMIFYPESFCQRPEQPQH